MRNGEKGEVVFVALVVVFLASVVVSRFQLHKIMKEEQISIKSGIGTVASAR